MKRSLRREKVKWARRAAGPYRWDGPDPGAGIACRDSSEKRIHPQTDRIETLQMAEDPALECLGTSLAGLLYAVALQYFVFPSKVVLTGFEGLITHEKLHEVLDGSRGHEASDDQEIRRKYAAVCQDLWKHGWGVPPGPDRRGAGRLCSIYPQNGESG